MSNYCRQCYKKVGYNKKNCAALGYKECDGNCDYERCHIRVSEKKKVRDKKKLKNDEQRKRKKEAFAEKKRLSEANKKKKEELKKKKEECSLSLQSLPSRVNGEAVVGIVGEYIQQLSIVETAESVAKKMGLDKYFPKKKKAAAEITDVKSSSRTTVRSSTDDIGGTTVGSSGEVSGTIVGSNGKVNGTTVGSDNVTTTTTIKEQRNEEIREELKNNKLSDLEMLDYNASLFNETKDNETNIIRDLNEEDPQLISSSSEEEEDSEEEDEEWDDIDLEEKVLCLGEKVKALTKELQMLKKK